MSTLTPEEMMKAMMQNNMPQEIPTMVPPVQQVAQATPEMPAMVPPVQQVAQATPEMPTIMAPVQQVIQAEQVEPIQNEMPHMMPPVQQEQVEMPTLVTQVETMVAPIEIMVTPVETMVTAETMVAQNTMPAIGTQINLQNGLDLENVMTPEEQVKLTQKETPVEPIVINGLESIGSCKTSTWSALITILDFIAKDLSNNDIIAIDNGSIDTHRNGNFIHCDMKNILGNISLNLTSPDTSVKLLKLIKGGELIQIFKEDATKHYIFCNIQDGKILTRVKTSHASDTVSELSKAPLLPSPVFKKEIPNQEKEIIKTIIAGRSAVGSVEPYRFGFSKTDNSLVSIGVGKDFTHFFKDSSIEIDEYRVYNPFPVPNMESCIMEFFKCQDGTTWIKTTSNISVSSIICTEKVELIDSSIEDFDFS